MLLKEKGRKTSRVRTLIIRQVVFTSWHMILNILYDQSAFEIKLNIFLIWWTTGLSLTPVTNKASGFLISHLPFSQFVYTHQPNLKWNPLQMPRLSAFPAPPLTASSFTSPRVRSLKSRTQCRTQEDSWLCWLKNVLPLNTEQRVWILMAMRYFSVYFVINMQNCI